MVKSGIAKMVAPEVAKKGTHAIVDCYIVAQQSNSPTVSGSVWQCPAVSDGVRQCTDSVPTVSDSRLTIRMADERPQSPTAVRQPSDSSSDHHPAQTQHALQMVHSAHLLLLPAHSLPKKRGDM